MPMESLTGKREWVGEKGFFGIWTMPPFGNAWRKPFSVLPDAAGMNNHMGSAIMEDARSLSAVMEVLKEKDVPFVRQHDNGEKPWKSRCRGKGVALLERDVFLDSTDSVEVVKEHLRKAGEVALEKGSAIAIGHVGPEGGKNYGTGNQRGRAGAGAGRHYLCDRQ